MHYVISTFIALAVIKHVLHCKGCYNYHLKCWEFGLKYIEVLWIKKNLLSPAKVAFRELPPTVTDITAEIFKNSVQVRKISSVCLFGLSVSYGSSLYRIGIASTV